MVKKTLLLSFTAFLLTACNYAVSTGSEQAQEQVEPEATEEVTEQTAGSTTTYNTDPALFYPDSPCKTLEGVDGYFKSTNVGVKCIVIGETVPDTDCVITEDGSCKPLGEETEQENPELTEETEDTDSENSETENSEVTEATEEDKEVSSNSDTCTIGEDGLCQPVNPIL